ncbi:MAG: hypothetical protein COB89_05740 [Piscirickettsiaceae bacterium]|nr:MAG: hypothetical protein COB89_05740 [Piscirickettsiaceae bacterium]
MTARWPAHHTNITAEQLQLAINKVSAPFKSLCEQQQISDDLTPYLQTLYIPFADWLRNKQCKAQQTLIVGINGAQGSGKSTFCELVACVLTHAYGLNTVTLSIDDIYKTREQRLQMAQDIHPLFVTRGVPGTHDTELGITLLSQFKQLNNGETITYPVFDKGNDDRASKNHWPHCKGPIDIVFFEGWCVGARPQADAELVKAVNTLEKEEDKQGTWRRYANDALKGDYHELFSLLDRLVFLKIPSVDAILKWRGLQEQKLIGQHRHEKHLMNSSSSLRRFLSHYDRLTQHQLNDMPTIADIVIDIGNDHQAKNVSFRRG